MANKVTIQDIADALGISRNTVSKAINNTGILADSTRNKVLQKAMEMGYKQFSYISIIDTKAETPSQIVEKNQEIALLTSRFLDDAHFSSPMLDKFQRETAQLGYGLSIHRLLPEEIQELALPKSFDMKKTAGMICYEMFNYEYCKMLCELDIPVLFVDCPPVGLNEPLKADLLLMDNKSGIYSFVREMVRRGKTQIGFIGEYLHCQSFFERYMAYRNAMYLHGIACPEEYCLLADQENESDMVSQNYRAYLTERLQRLEHLPDVFICANDFVAVDTLHALHGLGYTVPQDVYLCGFDDSPSSKIIIPSLTTIHIHSQIMGFSAVHLLVSRIKEPFLNYRTIYTETSLIFRESTGD